ncbi:C40 family peptidase [Piscinibacter defluvii]|uniref:C40 family peptidase n=1 Tax=Piscinibacter defluvii TaxID=1796922 RepID=UPI000FDEDF19|nr:C40 family peptidase [Piscinibacter defluvii]
MPAAPTLRRLAPLAVALGLAGAPAWAAPEGDAITRMLAEKGLLDAPQSGSPDGGLVQQVRDKASDMVLAAMNFLGVRYRRGGSTAEDGFDCSGFTRHIFERSLGLVLPRRVDEQAKAPGLVGVKRDELRPGDLVFFNTLKRTFSHVGIYIGDHKFIHSPRAGGEVRIEDMRLAYWTKRFTGARRAEPLNGSAAIPAANPAVLPTTPQAVPVPGVESPPRPTVNDAEHFRTTF